MRRKRLATGVAAAAVAALLAGGGLFLADYLRVAAHVNDAIIYVRDVDARVLVYREAANLTDDASWERSLEVDGTTEEAVRAQYLDELIEFELVRQAAAERGVTADDEEVAARAEQMRADMLQQIGTQGGVGDAGDGDAEQDEMDELRWSQALATSGYDERTFMDAVRVTVLGEKMRAGFDSDADYNAWFREFVSQQHVKKG